MAELLKRGPPSGGWLPAEHEPGLVSVVIPTYNNADLIGETLASILAQTYDRVEVVVTDDGSTDNTQTVLAQWRERFRAERGWELKTLRQEKKGTNAARNLGARASRGEYLNFFDSDDLMTADRLAAHVRTLRAGSLDLVHGTIARFYQGRGGFFLAAAKSFGDHGPEALRVWLRQWGLLLPMCLMTRGFLDRLGPLDERLVGGKVDSDNLVRMLMLHPRMAPCPEGCLFYRRHLRSTIHNVSPHGYANVIYWLTRLERQLEQSGQLDTYRRELGRKFREYAVDAYRDGVVDLADYCAGRVAVHDPECVSRVSAFERLRFRLLGLRGALRAKGLSARLRRGRLRLVSRLGMAPRMEPATWVAQLPLQAAASDRPGKIGS